MLNHGRIGLAVCAAGIGAVALAAADATADAERAGPVFALIAAAAAAGVLGRLAAAVTWLPCLVVAAAATLAVLPFLPDAGEPLAAPLGYANADGTLFVIGALAALALVLGRGVPAPIRPLGIGGVVVLGIATAATRSAASLALLALGAVLVVAGLARPRHAAALGAAIAAGMLVVTVAVAAAFAGDIEGNAVGVRVALWRDALEVAVEHPLTGVGPGGYQAVQEITDDPDFRWAHHGPIQLAAELGAVGAAVALAAVGWAYVRAGLARPTPGAAAAAATTVLLVQSCVDYVLHEGALVVVVAFLLGGAAPWDRQPG